MQGPQKLPEARLQPKDGADRLAILKGHARTGARTAGTIAGIGIRTVAIVACAGIGLWAIGSTHSRSPELDKLDRQMENLRRMNESLRTMPKIDWDSYYRALDTTRNHQFDYVPRGTTQTDLDKMRDDLERLNWAFPKPSAPSTRVESQSPAVSSQPPGAQQRGALAP